MYLITYELPDKTIKDRIVKNNAFYKVGNINGLGWKIINIQIYDIDSFVSIQTYRIRAKERIDKRGK